MYLRYKYQVLRIKSMLPIFVALSICHCYVFNISHDLNGAAIHEIDRAAIVGFGKIVFLRKSAS